MYNNEYKTKITMTSLMTSLFDLVWRKWFYTPSCAKKCIML